MTMVLYSIGVDQPITPGAELPPVPGIPRRALVVVGGRAPIWRYGQAFHRLHGTAAGAIAVYDPRYGAVIVASHIPEYEEGQVIEMDWPSNGGSSAAVKEPASKESGHSEETPSSAPNPNAFSAEKEHSERKPDHFGDSPDEKGLRFGTMLKEWLSPIKAYSYRLIFHFAEDAEFEIPRLRGIWGMALRSLNYRLYQKLFEGINPDYNLKRTPRYILRPSDAVPNDALPNTEPNGFFEGIDFITWGISEKERDDLFQAWTIAADMGIGHDRLPFRLIQILPGGDTENGFLSMQTILNRQPAASPVPCRLNFPLPLRLIASEDGVNHPIFEPRLSEIIKSAVFRLAAVRFQMTSDVPLDENSNPKWQPEFAGELIQWAEKIPASGWTGKKLALRRYSGRQRSEINLTGTAGFLDLPNGAGPLIPLLTAAEYFHIGKTTTLGLGRLTIEELSASDASPL